MATLGSRIRELRISHNLTLDQVSSETGLSVSFLSMVERDKVSISVDNLEKLAHFYQIHIVHFFNAPDENPILITRRDQILKSIDKNNLSQAAFSLLTNKPDSKMEPILIRIAPGKEEPHFRKHEADTLLYVLEGQATIISETGEQIDLYQGDLAYYVNYPHRRIANANKKKQLVIISITAPPTSSLDEMLAARQGSWLMTNNLSEEE